MAVPAYTAIPDIDVDPESPITTSLMLALRNNPLAIAGRGAGAPDNLASHITDGAVNLKMKALTSTWDMDASQLHTIAHGLAAADIRAIFGRIENNAGTSWLIFPYNLAAGAGNEITGNNPSWDATNVRLIRTGGGLVDNANWNAAKVALIVWSV